MDGWTGNGRTAVLVSALAVPALGLLVLRRGLTSECLELVAFCCILAYVSVTDLTRRVIPNRAVLLAVGIRLTYLLCLGDEVIDAIVHGFALCLPAALLALCLGHGRGGAVLGGGDVKLLFAMGCHLGLWEGLAVVTLACLASVAVAALRALCAHDPGPLRHPFPFAPYLSLACWLGLVGFT